MKRTMMIIGTLLALFTGPLSASANILTVASGADGNVMIAAGNDVNGVERIELNFSYSTEFSGPRVTVQGGDYSIEQMVRDSKPGFLKLAVNRDGEEMLADAFVLVVEFDKKPADQPCPVKSAAAKYFYASGDIASPEVDITPLNEVKKPAPALDSRSAKPAAQGPGAGGAIPTNRPASAAPGPNGQYGEKEGGRSSGQDKPEVKEKPGAGETLVTLEYQACPDPLQPFREYRGDRKLAGLLPLFAFPNPCGCRQTPPVAISDGLGKVSLSFEADPDARKAPNYWVAGARFLSLKRDSEKSWTIELLPNHGEHEVVLYVITGRVLKRIPLTVAAPLALFLGRLTPEEALSPLLEFTIAANYLAGHKETAANVGK